MDRVTLARDTATATEIEAHLRACSDDFLPPLATRVDITGYAAKLHSYASNYEAWHERELVALVSVYRDEGTRTAFVSSVSSVASFRGRGLARTLLTQALDHVDRAGLGPVDLDVDGRSSAALGLYRSMGFAEVARTGTTLRLSRARRGGGRA